FRMGRRVSATQRWRCAACLSAELLRKRLKNNDLNKCLWGHVQCLRMGAHTSARGNGSRAAPLAGPAHPEVSMRIVPDSQKFRSRLAQMLALGGVITTASCKDVSAPQKTLETPVLTLSQSAAAGDELGSLGTSLDDMTAWSLASLPEGESRVKIVGIVNGLRGHLKSGKIQASQQDVSDARAFL